jgi:hypothetical protein
MDWIIAAGTISLGVLIGILVGYFVNEAKKMDKALLTSAIGILAGGGVVAIFSLLGGLKEPPHEVWLYPCGLLAGYFIATVYEHVFPSQ